MIAKQKFTPNTVISCDRCGRTARLKRSDSWNGVWRAGALLGFLCPSCQTSDENTEAEINDATTVYGQDAFGRVIGRPKGVAS